MDTTLYGVPRVAIARAGPLDAGLFVFYFLFVEFFSLETWAHWIAFDDHGLTEYLAV